eukprot:comp23496_c0_seq1/m.39347 comp23496_c0_seq1/g.39347  ORF comp23496_c0_seq1/g.39347 comp23496_c0_seq1/m.39347 type:complete len:359 (-) comp23496_c0_seq1:383-1459(-)
MASRVSVGLIGPGLVGGALLEQLVAHQVKHGEKSLVRVAGIINSKQMLLLGKDSWEQEVSKWGQAGCAQADMSAFIDHLAAQPHGIVVDCTSNESVANSYPSWMQKGLHIVTPNKKGFSGDLKLFREIMALNASKKAFAYHEATVGAGLPVISTLNSLVRTGDEIVRIEGIFSGTMSFLFNSFSSPSGASPLPFSQWVQTAKANGYTEPDPRDDLNGMDVARKVVILGRVSGLDLTLDTLKVQNVVPEPLQAVATADEFMQRLPEFDDYFAKLNADAAARGEVLRYVGVVDGAGVSAAELRSYPYSHPFASLKGSDNIIAFTTKRYPNPLIVQGAGAGAQVTAAGIFSDILTIADRVL